MTEQSTALRLANAIDPATIHALAFCREAAAELRRLYEENQRLRGIVPEVLERLNDELCDENAMLHQRHHDDNVEYTRVLAQRDQLLALLGNIRGWDILDATADGMYWKREIDAAIKQAKE